jgi:hypothetical protein
LKLEEEFKRDRTRVLCIKRTRQEGNTLIKITGYPKEASELERDVMVITARILFEG